LPGRDPREAVDRFLEPLRDSLSCVAQAKITLSAGGLAQTGRIHALTVNGDQPVRLQRRRWDRQVLMLRIQMQYEIVRTEDAGRPPWRTSTRAYAYELQTASGEVVLSFHWHPSSVVSTPHIHVGHTQLAPDAVLFQKAHHPTGRVSLESVVRACITDYNAKPLRDDWEKTLALREGDFQIYRSWS